MTTATAEHFEGAAEGYQDLGWPVFPVRGKIPATKNGCLDATTEPWRAWPRSATGVGFATGTVSGIWVLDLDSEEAERRWETMQDEHGERIATVTAKTGKGFHVYFKMPPGRDIRNSAGKVGPGIDVRGTGGYVVLPPSAHPDGGVYEWVRDRSPDDFPVAVTPRWLVDLVCGRADTRTNAPALGEVIGEGGRNATLTSLAGTLRRRGMSEEAIAAALHVENRGRCVPPLPAVEVDAIASSVARYVPSAGSTPDGTPRFGGASYELLNVGQLEDRPVAESLITGLFPEGALISLFGAPGSGKSFAALDWGLCVATGEPWAGRAVRQGGVVYVSGEGSGGLGQRSRAWRDCHPMADVSDMYFLLDALPLMDHQAVLRFVATIRDRVPNPKLVVFDTLARCTLGADENSARDMGLAIHGADIVRRELGCAVLLIHHTNASGDRERGSTALRGAVDVLMSLRNDERGITLKCEKSKDSEPFDDIRLKLSKRLDSAVLTPDFDVGVRGDFLTARQVETLRSLHISALDDGLTVSTWLEVSGQKSSSFYGHRKSLVDKGFVRQHREGRGARYTVTAKGEAALTPLTPSHSNGTLELAGTSLPPLPPLLGGGECGVKVGKDEER